MIGNVWTWLGSLNWAAIAGVVSVMGFVGGFGKWIMTELRKNTEATEAVKGKVTTPGTVSGTIGETVAQISVDVEEHNSIDEARFEKVWRELGKPEPK